MNPTHREILSVLADTEWRSTSEIAALINCDVRNTGSSLCAMKKEKLVARIRHNGSFSWAVTNHGLITLRELSDGKPFG